MQPAYNLLNERWITVRRKNNEVCMVAPHELTTDFEMNPIVEIYEPRPDFSAAVMLFLIGLFQTLCPPQDTEDWIDKWEDPPSPEELYQKFRRGIRAFNLNGDGPRFMQDFDEIRTKPKPINFLLIDDVGEAGLKKNNDHFVHRGQVGAMCYGCAAKALFTLQTNGVAGGSGHLTGLRGGGPVSNVFVTDTLYRTCWLNVIDEFLFQEEFGNNRLEDLSYTFPWLTHTRGKKNGKTTPSDTNANHVFWGTPRRIRFQETGTIGQCSICGLKDTLLLEQYATVPGGIDYAGAWRHPLTPSYKSGNDILSQHMQPAGITYKCWPGLIVDSKNKPSYRSRIFEVYSKRVRELKGVTPDINARVWVFGYDVVNSKARCWYEGVLPAIEVDESIQEAFTVSINYFVHATEEIGRLLQFYTKTALFANIKKVKGFGVITDQLWQETETDFHAFIQRLQAHLMSGEPSFKVVEDWLNLVRTKAVSIFDASVNDYIEESTHLSRTIDARNKFRASIYTKEFQESLGIPIDLNGGATNV